MLLLPQLGGGWTECEVAELQVGCLSLSLPSCTVLCANVRIEVLGWIPRNAIENYCVRGWHLVSSASFDRSANNCPRSHLCTSAAAAAATQNGSVLLTSRNFFGRSSGQGPRLFARSDDGGASWAANWSAGADLPDPYCEAALLSRCFTPCAKLNVRSLSMVDEFIVLVL